MQWHTKHSSKTYMFLLKCLHDMNENVTYPLSCLEPSLIPSRMPKPRVRKYRFQNKRFFILENILKTKGFLFSKTYYRVSVKSIGQPFEVNCLVVLRNNHGPLRRELLDKSPKQFFGKSSLEIPFTTIFFFLSCHALTPITLGSPVHMKCNMPFHNNSC